MTEPYSISTKLTWHSAQGNAHSSTKVTIFAFDPDNPIIFEIEKGFNTSFETVAQAEDAAMKWLKSFARAVMSQAFLESVNIECGGPGAVPICRAKMKQMQCRPNDPFSFVVEGIGGLTEAINAVPSECQERAAKLFAAIPTS